MLIGFPFLVGVSEVNASIWNEGALMQETSTIQTGFSPDMKKIGEFQYFILGLTIS